MWNHENVFVRNPLTLKHPNNLTPPPPHLDLGSKPKSTFLRKVGKTHLSLGSPLTNPHGIMKFTSQDIAHIHITHAHLIPKLFSLDYQPSHLDHPLTVEHNMSPCPNLTSLSFNLQIPYSHISTLCTITHPSLTFYATFKSPIPLLDLTKFDELIALITADGTKNFTFEEIKS